MQDSLRLLLAMGLPWLVGICTLARLWPSDRSGRLAAIAGYGYFCGMALTAFLLLVLEEITGRWNYGLVIASLAGCACVAYGCNWRWIDPVHALRTFPATCRAAWHSSTLSVRMLAVLLGLLISWRLAILFLEVIWRPVYAWDAWNFWSYRARIFFESGGGVPPISPRDWLIGSEVGYTLDGRHPPMVSLFQLWPALALDRWDESLVNLPWWLAGIALPLAVYGQLRVAGVRASIGLVATYALISLPHYGAHIALAGYADLWVAAIVGLGAMSLYLLFIREHRRQSLILILAIFSLPFIKQSGIIYALLFILALLIALIPSSWILITLVTLAFSFVAVIFSVGLDINLPMLGHLSISSEAVKLPRGLELGYVPVWDFLALRLFRESTWHLLWFIVPILLGAGGILAWHYSEHRALAVLVLSVLVLNLVVYVFTSERRNLIDGTGINRQLLIIVPVLIFWGSLLIERYLDRRASYPNIPP